MIIFSFFLSTTALILQSVAVPFTILAYAPWIALCTLRCSLPKTLWLSAAAGAILDCLTDDPIGVHALNYVAISLLLHSFRKRFSFDRPLHLSLFTIAFSFFSTLFQLFLLFLFDTRIPYDGKWVFGDLIGMAVADGLYALIWFAAPLYFYSKLRHYGGIYWHRIKANLFPI